MADVDRREDVDLRERVTRLVYDNLSDRAFRQCLTATAEDGSRPIIVVLPADPMLELVRKVEAAGGAGNIVMPKANGFVVVAVERDAQDDKDAGLLTPDCTAGVFVARVLADGAGNSYRFAVEGPGERRGTGRAELVALGR
jgi:hypothetical protein